MREEQGPDLTGMYTRNIAFDRFILKLDRFSDLPGAAFVRRA